MTDTTDPREGGSEYECVHCGAFDTGTTHWERCEKHPAHAAIRALEAKVEQEMNNRDTLQDDLHATMAQRDAAIDRATLAENDRDRLAGEVGRLQGGVEFWRGSHAKVSAEVARLTSELAAARENEARYVWLKDNAYLWPTMPCTSVDQAERCGLWLDDERVDIDAEIDAARRAGEGEA